MQPRNLAHACFDGLVCAIVFVALYLLASTALAQCGPGGCGPGGCPAPGVPQFGPGGWGGQAGPVGPFGGVPQQPQQPQYSPQPQQSPAPQSGGESSQWHGVEDPSLYQFMCRVQAPDGKAGSGAWVDYDGVRTIVFTAAHVVEGNQSAKCVFATGTINGRVAACDRGSDCAAIELESRPSGGAPVRLADTYPGSGSKCTLIGFGGSPRKGFLARGGVLRGLSGEGKLMIAGGASHGDSGGAVLSSDGRFFAIISATDTDYKTSAYVAYYGPLRQLLGMPPRYDYQMQHGLPPHGKSAQQGGPGGGNYVPPVLPNTADLVTRAEYETDKARLMEVLRNADLLQNAVDQVEGKVQAVEGKVQAVEGRASEAAAAAGQVQQQLQSVAGHVQAVEGEASTAAAEAAESKSLLARIKERLDGVEGNVVKIDGKIAGVVDTGDFLKLAGEFRDFRGELLNENSTIRDRLQADVEAAKQLVVSHKDEIKAEVLEEAKERLPGIPWGLISLAIGLGTGGAGLGLGGIVTAIMRKGGGDVGQLLAHLHALRGGGGSGAP